MASSRLYLLFSLFFCIINGSLQNPGVTLSLNATSVEVGSSVTLRCEVLNFNPGKGESVVTFYRDGGSIYQYTISVSDAGKWTTTFFNLTNLPDITMKPLTNLFPIYEMSVMPKIASSHGYACNLYKYAVVSTYSNTIAITATSPPPTLTTNVTSVPLNAPFTVTCTFAYLTKPIAGYSVKFYNNRDGELATYEIANGQTVLDVKAYESIDVSPGDSELFPTFDLVLTERNDTDSVYWCTMEEPGKSSLKSNVWTAAVQFTGSKPTDGKRTGSCSVGGTSLNLKGQAYSVQFWADLGPKAENLLAEYIFTATHAQVFKWHPVAPWGAISHGPSTWPQFNILVTEGSDSSLHGHWWCRLTVGVPGSSTYREFKSNKADL